MKRLTIVTLVFFICKFLSAQSYKDGVLGRTNISELTLYKERLERDFYSRKEKALTKALQHGWLVKESDSLRAIELQSIDRQGSPVYYITNNADAAYITGTLKLWNGGSLNLNLDGEGMTIGEWDAGKVYSTHQEFNNTGIPRVEQKDTASQPNEHATMIAGTLIAGGIVSDAKGMAYNANIHAYDWNNDYSELANAAANGLLISNHSYGYATGWTNSSFGWFWAGNETISPFEDYHFGFYGEYCSKLDSIANNAPYLLICKSSGNDNNEGDGQAGHPADGNMGYDCIGWTGNAKNILTIGAVNDQANAVLPVSSTGPTDDGRIKPDICGNGEGLCTTSATGVDYYFINSGNTTSTATANVSGSLLLLQQHFNNLTGGYMQASTLKALAINSAKEMGETEGPDYKFGWGLLNCEEAANSITNNNKYSYLIEDTLMESDTIVLEIYSNTTEPIKATIAWNDPAGTPVMPQIDPADKMLVNDLDFWIEKDTVTYYPYVLNPSEPDMPASKNDNDIDNVEKVFISDTEEGVYKIYITHEGDLLNDEQAFSIIISGISNNMPVVRTNEAENIIEQSAKLNGEIMFDGGLEIIEKGFIFSTNSSPTFDDTVIIVNNGTQLFDTTVGNLEIQTNYYYRAYAINSNDTAYGDIIRFKTIEIIYVDQNATGANNGNSWEDALINLQDALTLATYNTEVWVAKGIYYPDEGLGQIDNDPASTFSIPDGVDVIGGFAEGETQVIERNLDLNETVLSGDLQQNDQNGIIADNADSIISIIDKKVSVGVNGFTIQNGKNAIKLRSTESHSGMTFDGYLEAAIINCKFRDNIGQSVIYIDDYVRYLYFYTVNIENCDFINNNSSEATILCEGYTQYDQYIQLKISNTKIVKNIGHGIKLVHPVNLTLQNVEMSDNEGAGIRISVEEVEFYITNSFLSNNPFSYTSSYLDKIKKAEIRNSILLNKGNGLQTLVDPEHYYFYNSNIEGCGGSGASWNTNIGNDMGGNIDEDPLFIFRASGIDTEVKGDYHFREGSPCLDAGNNEYCLLDYDLDGEARIQNGTIDMGPYEGIDSLNTRYVNKSATGNNDGSSWQDAFVHLQDALDTIKTPCQLWVAEGTYYPDEGASQTDNSRMSTFNVPEWIELYGGFNATESNLSQRSWIENETILSGDLLQDDDNVGDSSDNALHVVAFESGSSIIDGFTITKGNSDSLIFTNHYYGGGGVYNNGELNINNCKIIKNAAIAGGGLCNNNRIFLQNCQINENFGGGGGGAYNIGENMRIINCIISGNISIGGSAGGIYNNGTDFRMVNSIVSGNTALDDFGGGIYSEKEGEVINTTICNNYAYDRGGGVCGNLNFKLKNCNIFNNNIKSLYSSYHPEVSNCTVYFSNIKDSGGSGANWNPSLGVDSGGNIDLDPMFMYEPGWQAAPTTDGDYHLITGSPAIDAGNNSFNNLVFDLDGESRIINGTIDIGAYEGGRDDTISPVLITKGDTVYLNENGFAFMDLQDVVDSVYDNYFIKDTILSQYSFTCSDLGLNEIQISVVDSFLNSTTNIEHILVLDTISPNIYPHEATLQLDSSGIAILKYSDILDSITDNCTIIDTLISQTVFTCEDIGSHSIEVSAVDYSGNSAIEFVIVTVEDDILPSIVTQDNYFLLDSNGIAYLNPSSVIQNIWDNCSIIDTVFSQLVFDCNNIGSPINVEISVSDQFGNDIVGHSLISIYDSIAPVIAPDNISIALDSNGIATITNDLLILNAYDNCNIIDTTLSQYNFNCDDLGINEIIVSLIDNSGNTASNSMYVTVMDNISPVPFLSSLSDIVAECSVEISEIPIATDNCSGTIAATTNDSLAYDQQGDYIITWVYNDGNGNEVTQTQNVTISDETPPVPDVASLLDIVAECSVEISEFPTATDNCSGTIAATTNDPLTYNQQGSYTITWVYNDGNGNEVTQTQNVTISDETPPVPDVASLLDIVAECSVEISEIPTATDNCSGTISATTNDPLIYNQQGDFVITWSYQDGNENSTTQTQNVIIHDTQKPYVECIDNQVVFLEQGQTTYAVNGDEFDPVDWSDNCEIINLSNNFNDETTLNGEILQIGEYLIKWFAADVAGNVDSCEFDLSINEYDGIDELNSHSINIYPNPANDKIFIVCPGIIIPEVILSKVTGEKVYSKNNVQNYIEIDISYLQKGIYIIGIQLDDKQLYSKMIVE